MKIKCGHRDHWSISYGERVAIRLCTSCGKSWRMSTRPWNDGGPMPDAKWEEIVEPAEQTETTNEEVAP
jgi:hypothetical protein